MVENDQVRSGLADEVNRALAPHGLGAGGPRRRSRAVAGGHQAVGADRAGAGARRPIKSLVVPVAMVPVLLAATCSDQNACDHPPPGVGAVVTDVQASSDPCVGQPPLHVVAWHVQGGVRYPLRCGKTGRGGYGYLHITQDPTDDGGVGHGDPVNDASFAAEITNTLANGVEAPQGGGNWRYTVRYTDALLVARALRRRLAIDGDLGEPAQGEPGGAGYLADGLRGGGSASGSRGGCRCGGGPSAGL
ncbi:MAG TPA: hypothetical protein VLW53_16645, partial [Candidatus Eisenbacteria bacterium]|nr:hypothetical protein [Candidatus Eisenbacteria bacterium]